MNLFAPPPTKNQTEFYDKLSTGKVKRRLLSLEKRFSPEVAVSSPSFRKYFLKLIEPIFNRSMRVLDVGCGTGMYLPLVAPLCKSLIGIELSRGCAKLAQETILKYHLSNTSIAIHDSASIGLKEKTFDAAICVDSLHHIYHLEETLREIARLVKPDGDIVIFEPNVMNPALFALCLLDRNEWGALSRCYRGRYESLFL
jgi:2-polyprenyl-3-methyl-5-hydroxy-6-metoxy-1,4-benzoquinol methylase